jgi:capsular polysaccharide biosynthesis protein
MQDHIPCFERVVHARELCEPRRFHQKIRLHTNALEEVFINHLKKPIQKVPATIDRRVALMDLKDVTVMGTTGALLDEEQQTLISMHPSRTVATYHDFRLGFSKKVFRSGTPTLSMLGSWKGHQHYYHFLIERLPKLFYAIQHFGLGVSEPLEILRNEHLPDYQKKIFANLRRRFPLVSFTPVPENERWHYDQLFAVDYTQNARLSFADPSVLEFIRSLCFDDLPHSLKRPDRKLWVSRADAKKRRILNEKDLVPILERAGFEIIEPGTLDFTDQVKLFSEASQIAGPHGAGLTNLLFAAPGTPVLEIFSQSDIRSTFFLLSRSLQHQYNYVLGGQEKSRGSFNVDPKRFAIMLENLGRTHAIEGPALLDAAE